MLNITTVMRSLQDRITPLVSRPVLVDPTRTSNTPCVLIELPQLTPEATLCGDALVQHTVLVIGQPGAWVEIQKLAVLLGEVIAAVELINLGWSLAEPVVYTPLAVDGTADPCIAYRLTLEEFS